MLKTPAHRVEAARDIAQRLTRARSIAVCTHLGGDGDGWGSAAAIAHHFGASGAAIGLLAASPLPDRLGFLLPDGARTLAPDAEGIPVLQSADVQLVVDASEPSRLGEFAPHYQRERTIVIDHHAVASAEIEAALRLIDPYAAATAELVYDVLAHTGTALQAAVARALYVGLVTDTGSFRYSNATPHAHRLAAELIEAGADPEALYRPLFANLTPAELGTLQALLDGLGHEEELGLSWAALDRNVTRRFGALDEYEGVMDHLRNLEGTEIAVLFREVEAGVKVSWRSTGGADVAQLARSFGGGGHEKAAGATVGGDLSTVVGRVLEACRNLLRGRPPTRT